MISNWYFMITKKDVEHLKKLARVEFGEKETDDLVVDLEKILGFVSELKEANVLGMQEITHTTDLKNVFRKDENPQEFNEELLGNLISAFPEKEKTYLKVKAVLKK